ncbi:MAG: class I SAM-dependent methyltransferase [Alphaproteobacteria bacterium]
MKSELEILRELWTGFSATPLAIRLQQTMRALILPYNDLLKWLPAAPTMLDIGCGAGAFIYLARKGRDKTRMTGVDAPAPVRVAREVNPDARHAFVANTNFEDWPAEPVDCVTLIDVMHHVHPAVQNAFFEAALSRVRPGGTLVYKDMAAQPLVPAWINRIHDLLSARQWIRYYPLDAVKSALAGGGFKTRHEARIWRGPYLHELLVAERAAS